MNTDHRKALQASSDLGTLFEVDQVAQEPRNFFPLPAELRNQIYELVVHTSCPELDLRYGRLPKDSMWRTSLNCLATRRQFRREMLPMFWDNLIITTVARWQPIYPVPVTGLLPNEPPKRTMEPRLYPLVQELLAKMGPAQCSKTKRFVVCTPWKYLQEG